MAAAGPAGDARAVHAQHRARAGGRQRPALTDVALTREGSTTTPGARAGRAGWLHQRDPVRVQHRPRVPPRRRAHRAGADLVAHRRPQPRHADNRARGTGVRAGARPARPAGPLPSGSSLGLLTMVLAFFLYQAAAAAVVQGELARRIEHITVGDIMDREPVTIPAAATLLDAQEQFFLRYRWPWFAVVDPARHFLGVVRQQRIDDRDRRGPPGAVGGEVLEDDMPVRIGAEAPLESLLGSEGLGPPRRDGGGRQRGRAAGRRHARPGPPGAAPGDVSAAGPGGPPRAHAAGVKRPPSSTSASSSSPPPSSSTSHPACTTPTQEAMPAHDVLIIGAGLAGQRAALAAAETGRERGDHEQGSPRALPLGGRRRRNQRRDQRRRRLALARLRHGQGLGLPRRPGRDRSHVLGGPGRGHAPRAHRRHVPPQRRRASSTCAPSAGPR